MQGSGYVITNAYFTLCLYKNDVGEHKILEHKISNSCFVLKNSKKDS